MSYIEYQKSIIERVKNSSNPTKTFFNYYVNNPCIFPFTELVDMALDMPTISLNEKISKSKCIICQTSKQYINFEAFSNLAVNYIFKICFEYFFKEGYINAYNKEYKMLVSTLESWGDTKQLQLLDLEFDVLQHINFKPDLETYGGNTAYESCCELKHYKKYLNRPLWDFMQYLARVYKRVDHGDFYWRSYIIQDTKSHRWSKPSEYTRQVFKKYMDKHLGYSQEYDTKWDYSYFGVDGFGSPRLAYGNYDVINNEEMGAYIPITFTLNHYSCKFGNNIAIELLTTTKIDKDPNISSFMIMPRYDHKCLMPCYHNEYLNKLFENIIPIKYWNGREGEIYYICDGYVKMDWQSDDKWKCWIPFAPNYEFITYKFIELDENNKKIREETEFTTISMFDGNKCSDFETYRNWNV